jgi:heptosyltransferase I
VKNDKSRALPLSEAPGSICILRLSALGDVTHVVPVVRAIQARWPDTQISWIIGKPEHKLLQNLAGVEFVVFDKHGGLRAILDLRRRLRNRVYDVLLHMQVAARANLLSRLVKAPLRLGWDRARSRDRHHWFINHSIRSVAFQHQVEGFLEFARALGLQVEKPEWQLPVTDEDRAWAESRLPGGRPILMISPCSSHVLRNWRSENYALAADRAIEELGMEVVLIGGPGELERRTAREIRDAMKHPVLDLVGKDTLTQSMALMEKAAVVLTPDSGPAHIASALGTPVVGIYAATWSKRSGPYNSLDLCADRFPQAARKYRNSEPENLRWGTRIEVPGVMDLVSVAEVVEKLGRAMEMQQDF